MFLFHFPAARQAGAGGWNSQFLVPNNADSIALPPPTYSIEEERIKEFASVRFLPPPPILRRYNEL